MKINKKGLIIFLPVLVIVCALIFTANSVKNITILVDGRKIEYSSMNKSVRDALKSAGVEIGENDKINKNLDKKIINNEEIVVTRVEVKEEDVMEEIKYTTETVKNYKVNAGESSTITQGENGQKQSKYKVTYEDGIETKRELISENIIKEPVNEVISQGIFDINNIAVCVNQNKYIDSTYEPADLVIPNIRFASGSSNKYMRQEAAAALEKMFADAEAQGVYLYGVSGYRSYSIQSRLYAADPYSGYSAPPGASEHQLGLAMDISDSSGQLITEFEDTKEGQWLDNNSYKYGFILRYMKNKESITKYMYEPWHFRYIGIDLATKLYEKGLTLEEYYGEY